jgi:homoserine dehydrogenase
MAEKHFDLILVGFGNVGKAFAELLLEKSASLKLQYGFTFRVTGIHTFMHGSVINPDGLDLQQALHLIKASHG